MKSFTHHHIFIFAGLAVEDVVTGELIYQRHMLREQATSVTV